MFLEPADDANVGDAARAAAAEGDAHSRPLLRRRRNSDQEDEERDDRLTPGLDPQDG